jgi:glycosyltransferase involved in cell wall biosynthesis
MSDLRVLIVSENISMKMGGEASLPFYYAKLLPKRGVDVWLACHERVSAEISESMPELTSRVSFVRDTPLQKLAFTYGKKLPPRIRDLLVDQAIHFSTQARIRAIARDLARDRKIDVVLEPAPITPKGLSFMYDIGVPVVIGPMCGGMNFPPGFRQLDSIATRLSVSLGRRASTLANRVIPGKLRAEMLLVANQWTDDALPPGHRGRVVRLFESGVDLDLWLPPPQASDATRSDSTVRFVFSGRFADWKGIQYLLPAFEKAGAQNQDCCLELIGGGGDLAEEVQNMVNRSAYRDRIRMRGWVSRNEAAAILRDADVFVMPSLRECGGTAILEAMAMGKPVITTNWGGPADYVDSSCGILVNPESEDAFIHGLAEAIVALAQSSELRRTLGEGGKRRVREDFLDWDSKADRVVSILREVTRRT